MSGFLDLFPSTIPSTISATNTNPQIPEECKEINDLSKQITNNISKIEQFVRDDNAGFLFNLQADLNYIKKLITDLKDSKIRVMVINEELKKKTPDIELIARELVKERDAEIVKLNPEIERLKQLQNQTSPPASVRQISDQTDRCKQVCINILQDINTKLAAIVKKFNNYQTTINDLLLQIKETLLPPAIGSSRQLSTGPSSSGPQSKQKGGYYYSASTSSNKRNKKSTRNRNKNKKNKKTRR